MNEYKYYIKTQEEFIKEFGSEFPSNFIPDMKYLYGLEITTNKEIKDDTTYTCLYLELPIHNAIENWNIDPHMIKRVEFDINSLDMLSLASRLKRFLNEIL